MPDLALGPTACPPDVPAARAARRAQYTFRHMMGGYALASRLVVGVIEATGIITAVLGILGCWCAAYLRCAGLLLVYVVDVPLMANCEGWVNSIDEMQKEHGWNALMYDLAIGGYCNSERTLFFMLTAITFALCLYVAACSRRYAEVMDQAPRHLLRVPKDLPSGAYYASSHGERVRLNGDAAAPPRLLGAQHALPGGSPEVRGNCDCRLSLVKRGRGVNSAHSSAHCLSLLTPAICLCLAACNTALAYCCFR
ncbi:unnamed protein product [Prorocentrum cordatum]|uniref:Uncharacterized protein n=1 Tax=Prorocentrum cordatum TaxID=2364126 RepID=A0ABN9QLG9_9DINO|nr:unnamed protein product [Polarella glacialis]